MKKAAETWDGDWWKLGGGGAVWDGMAYDPDADLFYVGTGNAGPWPEELRTVEGQGQSLRRSILAVNAETGELKWHFQMVPGDSWDYDSVQHLMLADITIKGKPRKVIMQANKNGFYYVIDRMTGAVHFRRSLSRRSPGPRARSKNRPADRESRSALRRRSDVTSRRAPGGAHNWSPMSFNPNTGLVYIPTSTVSTMTFAVDRNFAPKPAFRTPAWLPGRETAAVKTRPRRPRRCLLRRRSARVALTVSAAL